LLLGLLLGLRWGLFLWLYRDLFTCLCCGLLVCLVSCRRIHWVRFVTNLRCCLLGLRTSLFRLGLLLRSLLLRSLFLCSLLLCSLFLRSLLLCSLLLGSCSPTPATAVRVLLLGSNNLHLLNHRFRGRLLFLFTSGKRQHKCQQYYSSYHGLPHILSEKQDRQQDLCCQYHQLTSVNAQQAFT
jgi:hypothetical protein